MVPRQGSRLFFVLVLMVLGLHGTTQAQTILVERYVNGSFVSSTSVAAGSDITVCATSGATSGTCIFSFLNAYFNRGTVLCP